MRDHPFWYWLTLASVVWYSTITIYVTIKGIADIRTMLLTLRQRPEVEPQEDS